MIELGSKMRDKVTGLTGIVTGKAQYLSGIAKCLIEAHVCDPSKEGAAVWLDECRLEAVTENPTNEQVSS